MHLNTGMSYINNEEKMGKPTHTVFTYVGVNDASNTSVLYLSIRIDDITKFVINRVNGDVKSKSRGINLFI